MCRTGGRRCPAYTDPVQIAARNARRRAAYAMKKSKQPSNVASNVFVKSDNHSEEVNSPSQKMSNMLEDLTKEKKATTKVQKKKSVYSKPVSSKKATKANEKTTKTATASNQELKKTDEKPKNSENIVAAPIFDNPAVFNPVFEGESFDVNVKGKTFKKASGDKLFKVDKESHVYDEELNVSSYNNEGLLCDNHYFNNKTVTGLLDYTKIDGKPETDEKLGFRKMTKQYDIYTDNPVGYDALEEFKEMSRSEVKDFTSDESTVVREFSVSTYEWLNDALYQKEVAKGVGTKAKNFAEKLESANYSKSERTFKALTETVEKMDGALSKGPKKQRTLYRGVASYASLFNSKSGTKSVSDWVDENLEIGKEIKFDGYQSATPKPQAMGSFLSNKGLMYEIITPEGVNISSNSSFAKEYEVTLPRDAKYTVVSINKNVDVQHGDDKYSHSISKDVTVVRLIATNSKGEILDGTNSDTPAPLKNKDFKKIDTKTEW